MNQVNKIVARVEEGEHFLFYKTQDGTLLEVENDTKKIVQVEGEKMADKLSQLFPGLHLKAKSLFCLISLED